MDYIFSNKKKNALAACFSLFYLVMLIWNIDLGSSPFQNLRYTLHMLRIYILPIVTPLLTLVCLLTPLKSPSVKRGLLTVALGVPVATSFVALLSMLPNLDLLIAQPQNRPLLLSSFFMFASTIFMFIGTLVPAKHIKLLKYGALSYAILNFIRIILDFIAAGGFAYLKAVGAQAVNVILLGQSLCCTLFYLGIFILTTNKRKHTE